MNAILTLIDNIIDIYIFTLLAYVIASWLVAFKIINPWQPFVRWILQALGRLHEPLLSRIRSVLPDFGGIDISPIIVLLAVQFGRNLCSNMQVKQLPSVEPSQRIGWMVFLENSVIFANLSGRPDS